MSTCSSRSEAACVRRAVVSKVAGSIGRLPRTLSLLTDPTRRLNQDAIAIGFGEVLPVNSKSA